MKFVLHRHITDVSHFDLMLDTGSALPTWRIPLESLDALINGKSISCERIHDHRRAYLDTTQPIVCSKGRVEPADTGDCEIISIQQDVYTVTLAGELIAGRFTLSQNSIHRA